MLQKKLVGAWNSVASCEIIFTFYQKDRIKSFTKSV